MSGIGGIVLAPGRSVDAPLLQLMAASLHFRGPDGDSTWIGGAVGFAHALLRTGDAAVVPQPCTLDGSTWITADARIDGRADLIRRLEADAHANLSTCDDSQLILHAYRAWGERCVDHLLGDFAFAIWDSRERRLFCARDHFGVKPFYYAEVDGGLVFSNTLDCVRTHPAVSDALDELFIADFLVCGCSQQLTATAYAQVKRLAPAHSLSMSGGPAAVRRYWSLPTAGRIRYRKSADYVEHFRELLNAAVGDRIRDCAPAIWMSGGLDSTAIAATAQRILKERGAAAQARAYTVIYESLFDDTERRYAQIASRAIGIATQYLSADQSLPFAGWDDSEIHNPEPLDDPYHLLRTRQLHQVAESNRVALSPYRRRSWLATWPVVCWFIVDGRRLVFAPGWKPGADVSSLARGSPNGSIRTWCIDSASRHDFGTTMRRPPVSTRYARKRRVDCPLHSCIHFWRATTPASPGWRWSIDGRSLMSAL
jgi:asparagine synthase (glutamine-hydrolysing)